MNKVLPRIRFAQCGSFSGSLRLFISGICILATISCQSIPSGDSTKQSSYYTNFIFPRSLNGVVLEFDIPRSEGHTYRSYEMIAEKKVRITNYESVNGTITAMSTSIISFSNGGERLESYIYASFGEGMKNLGTRSLNLKYKKWTPNSYEMSSPMYVAPGYNQEYEMKESRTFDMIETKLVVVTTIVESIDGSTTTTTKKSVYAEGVGLLEESNPSTSLENTEHVVRRIPLTDFEKMYGISKNF